MELFYNDHQILVFVCETFPGWMVNLIISYQEEGVQSRLATVGANAFVEEALRWLPEAANETMPRRSDTETSRLSSNRILFADDSADLRQYVHRRIFARHPERSLSIGGQLHFIGLTQKTLRCM